MYSYFSDAKNLKDTSDVSQACTQTFSLGGGGTDPEAVCNLCFIMKTML
jgi:hypothetical protein